MALRTTKKISITVNIDKPSAAEDFRLSHLINF